MSSELSSEILEFVRKFPLVKLICSSFSINWFNQFKSSRILLTVVHRTTPYKLLPHHFL